MVSIKWLKFLSCNFILFFNKLHFPHNVFCLTIPYLHSYSIIFLRMSSPRCLSFSFPLSPLFPFLFFPHFSFFLFFFLFFLFLFFSFFPFSQFVSFPQFSLPFPKSAAPVLPHFLLPCLNNIKITMDSWECVLSSSSPMWLCTLSWGSLWKKIIYIRGWHFLQKGGPKFTKSWRR